jgi:hypothetical protein
MPYKSEAQRKYFNANEQQLEKGGVNVAEWNRESRGMKLPNKIVQAKSKKKKLKT